jgi:hypothetical protein
MTVVELTQRLTQERGSIYGTPERNFDRIARLTAVLEECPDPRAKHALYEICVKISRLIETPDHEDSWNDIQGYARCGKVVMGIEE